MKLYWRFKKPDGKWTYRRASILEEYDRFTLQYDNVVVVEVEEE